MRDQPGLPVSVTSNQILLVTDSSPTVAVISISWLPGSVLVPTRQVQLTRPPASETRGVSPCAVLARVP